MDNYYPVAFACKISPLTLWITPSLNATLFWYLKRSLQSLHFKIRLWSPLHPLSLLNISYFQVCWPVYDMFCHRCFRFNQLFHSKKAPWLGAYIGCPQSLTYYLNLFFGIAGFKFPILNRWFPQGSNLRLSLSMWRVPCLNCTYTIIPVSRVHPSRRLKARNLKCITYMLSR